MTKTEFVNEVAEEAKLPKTSAAKAVDAFMEVVKSELAAGGIVQIIGFGTFDVRKRSAREGINPQTGEKVAIPEKFTPHFKAGKSLKDAVK